jgi:ketosteroid isomerase-like protein
VILPKLTNLTVTNAGDEYVVHVEDDAGVVMELSATREQILLMDSFRDVTAITGEDVRSAIEDAETAVVQATNAKDANGLTDLLSSEVLINSPANKVIGRDQMLEMTANGEMTYADYVRTTDAFSLYGSRIAAVMGEERFSHADPAFGDGTVIRRYTDVWAKDGRSWKLIIRQATYTTSDEMSE